MTAELPSVSHFAVLVSLLQSDDITRKRLAETISGSVTAKKRLVRNFSVYIKVETNEANIVSGSSLLKRLSANPGQESLVECVAY